MTHGGLHFRVEPLERRLCLSASAVAAAAVEPVGNEPIGVKVLVLSYDPTVPSRGGQHLYEIVGSWTNPRTLAADYETRLERAAGGKVDFTIVQWRDL